VQGAAKDLAAKLLAAFHRPVQVRHSRVTALGIGRDRIEARAHDRDPCGTQPQALEPLPQPAVGRQVASIEDRDLDSVEPQGLDLVDDRVLGLGHVVGPEEQVHAGFHGSFP
jgi:hypothetical protein